MTLPLHRFRTSPRSIDGFEIVRVESMPEIARIPQPHRHNFYEIFWIMGGQGIHHLDFERYTIAPYTLYLIMPGQVHYWESTEALAGYVMLFTDELLLGRDIQFPTPMLQVNTGDPFQGLCDQLFAEYHSDSLGRITVIQSLMQILLIQIHRHYAAVYPPKKTHPLIHDFTRLIDLHFHEYQMVSDYADRLGVTAGHLTDTVRAWTGESAGMLIRRRVILEAKRLLAHSDQAVAQIAKSLSFDDPSYFARYFKRQTGQSPLQFRKKYH